MLSRIIAGLLLLVSIGCRAVEFPIELVEYVDDARIVALVNESDIDAGAGWVPGSGSPPVSMDEALAIVQTAIADDPRFEGAAVDEVAIKRIPHHTEHWHYLVKLVSGTAHHPRLDFFVVLMNKKLIPAIREPGR